VKRPLLLAVLLFAIPVRAAAQPAETVEYYGQDVIGSIRIVWDANGNVVGRKDYSPFGRELFPAPQLSKEGFGAQEHDGEIDQAYFHARMFQPRTGRFTRADSLAAGATNESQQFNRYVYTRSNPLRFIDPTGLREKEADPEKKCDPKFVHCGKSNPPPIWLDPDLTITLAGMPSGPGGSVPRVIGRIGERILQLAGGTPIGLKTSRGWRSIDSLLNGVAQESKVGFVEKTKRIEMQIAKDLELLESGQIRAIEWHFFPSPITGLIGPSQALEQYLTSVGIRIVLHPLGGG
jgi:RHS repeat-associated protein